MTNEGAVKLLDFGIAKLLAPGALDHAAPPTRAGVWLMTPEYASPEQIRDDPVSTATDIYQLGLLLYGLLAGQQPYYLRDRTPLDAFRVICESEPLPPRSTTSGRLQRSLREAKRFTSAVIRLCPSQRFASPTSSLIGRRRRMPS